ncbi:Mercuric resistance operon regulatory protein [Afipia felis]|uniref:Mercuric resistance operon regulatory protein n=1 Tax=Afipia felis TaxID=1035 RepID=A0A090MRN7_AFIFE|nr:helix-turn-helix domain-containing protein [Afipia felis]CEG10050.1 Mercuric resistance operon regulatory protein [Afipia felis]
MFTIGELSKQTGVHVETVRYYERAGILPRAARTSNGRRTYGTADVRRLSFIRHARELGFELSAVRALLDLQDHPNATCEKASQIAVAQLLAIETKISRLKILHRELTRMIEGCGNVRVAECGIIEALSAA